MLIRSFHADVHKSQTLAIQITKQGFDRLVVILRTCRTATQSHTQISGTEKVVALVDLDIVTESTLHRALRSKSGNETITQAPPEIIGLIDGIPFNLKNFIVFKWRVHHAHLWFIDITATALNRLCFLN
ncbi:hypothetical protein D3C87_1503000 [compost metagenome]